MSESALDESVGGSVDAFEARHAQLEAQRANGADSEDRDEYLADNCSPSKTCLRMAARYRPLLVELTTLRSPPSDL